MKYARIVATGSALPPNPTSNVELAEKIAHFGSETSDEWIVERTGIRQRYLAEDPELTTTELATRAAREALGSVDPLTVNLIIVATTTPDRIFPSTACQVQSVLGCKNAAAFDLQAVCSGFVYALTVAEAYIRSGAADRILVIGSEVLSRLLDWTDRSTCVLFGDGAGAVLVEASEQPGILASEIGADGSLGVGVLAADARMVQGEVCGDPYIRMDGKAVFRAAVTTLSESANRVLAKAGMSASDLDLYIPHQANLRIMTMVAKHLGLPLERMMVSVDSHGNTSAASVPLSLDKARKSGRITEGSKVLLQGVGGGFTWGSVLVEF